MAFPYAYSDWVKMGKSIQLDDGQVFYVHKGEGFPVIMGHLYGGNSWWFSRVLDAVAEHFSVYAWDLPGCAQSQTPPFPYGPPEYADALKEFMDKLGIEKAHLVGNHGSSLTSAHFATTRPSRVGKLVMDGTPPWNRLEGRKYWHEKLRPNFLDENELPKPYDQWDHGLTGQPLPGLEDAEDRRIAVQRISQDFIDHGKWWVSILKEALKYDVYTRLHLIQAPTLVVNGEKEWGRISEQRVLNGIIGSRLAVIPTAGASPAFEQPEAWSKVVLDFLQGG